MEKGDFIHEFLVRVKVYMYWKKLTNSRPKRHSQLDHRFWHGKLWNQMDWNDNKWVLSIIRTILFHTILQDANMLWIFLASIPTQPKDSGDMIWFWCKSRIWIWIFGCNIGFFIYNRGGCWNEYSAKIHCNCWHCPCGVRVFPLSKV